MVLTTSSQWSLPFISTAGGAAAISVAPHPNSSSSTLFAPSPQSSTITGAAGLTCVKPGSVLGLKSCSLSKPPSSPSSSIAHLDLHTPSLSRRFIEAIVSDSPLAHYPTYRTRSAGSFRLDESFSWVNKDKELAFYGEKPICAMPNLCTGIVPIRAGRWSFEEKPTYELPWCSTHVAPVGADKFKTEGKPISVMPPSTTMDASALPLRASKIKDVHTLSSAMACSTSMESLAVPIRADQCSFEEKPISAKPFDTPGVPTTKLNNAENPISAIPHSSACEASIASPIIRAGRFNVELEGDITAADVDLLPMPGLVSLASPLYDSYLSVSPTDSRMTRISSSDYLSTANSTSNSASKAVPSYLGLPPEFLQEVDGKLTCCKVQVTSTEEEGLSCPNMRGGSNPCPESVPVTAFVGDFVASNSTVTNPYPPVEDDNFAESQSLAGLWSNHDGIHCDSNSVLHGSEALASILTDLPHKHYVEMAQSGPCNNIVDVQSSIGSEFIMDELDYLMMPGKAEAASGVGVLDAIPSMAMQQQQGLVVPTPSEATVKGGHFVTAYCKPEMRIQLGIPQSAKLYTSPYAQFEGKGCSSAGPCESSQGSSVVAPRMALLPTNARPNVPSHHMVNGAQSMCAASMPLNMDRKYMPNVPACMMIGKKRPFPVYDHLPRGLIPPLPALFNPNIPHALACESDSMQQELLESKAPEMSYSSATQALSAMLYKAQGGGGAHARLNWAASQLNDNGEGIKTPPSKARRRHGTAMDPQSIAARTRREKFSDRIRILQSLVPNGERLDTVSMLGQTLEYVRFLQHQVWQLYHGMDPASNIKCEKWKDFLEPAQPAST